MPFRAERSVDAAVARLAGLLQRWAGLALPTHRWPVLQTTLEHLAPDGTLEGALDRIEAGDAMGKRLLLARLTVPETYLFRHPGHFDALAEHARAAATSDRRAVYRVLSAGCATGEEAWSAAAVLEAVGRSTGLHWSVVGWELDADRVKRARAGRYSRWSARNGLFGHDEAFLPQPKGWVVHPRLRRFVRFECVNLKVGPAPGATPFDVVFFRNVAIYWAHECMDEMFDQLARLVAPGGLLLMGAAEPDLLDRSEWEVRWRGSVRIATRRARPVSRGLRRLDARRPSSGARPFTPRPLPPRFLRERSRRTETRSRPPEPTSSATAPQDAVECARELADRGRYLEALAILDDLPPSPHAELYLWRGIVYLNLHRNDEALAQLSTTAANLRPSNEITEVLWRRWRGRTYYASSRDSVVTNE